MITTGSIYAPVIKQCVFLGIGAGCVFVLHRWDYNDSKFLYLMIPGLALFTIFTLIYVMVAGEVINGAQRVMKLIPGVTLQPAELAKLSIVTLLSYILAKSQKNRDISTGGMIAAGAAVTIYGGLMIRSGMTNTLLLMAISVAMLVIGGAQFRKIVLLFGAYVIIGGMFFLIKHHNDDTDQVIAQAQTEFVAQGAAADGGGWGSCTGDTRVRAIGHLGQPHQGVVV